MTCFYSNTNYLKQLLNLCFLKNLQTLSGHSQLSYHIFLIHHSLWTNYYQQVYQNHLRSHRVLKSKITDLKNLKLLKAKNKQYSEWYFELQQDNRVLFLLVYYSKNFIRLILTEICWRESDYLTFGFVHINLWDRIIFIKCWRVM